MPCHSPTKATEMRSVTTALPSCAISMLSWKSETRHDFAARGAAKTRMTASNSGKRSLHRRFARFLAGNVSTAEVTIMLLELHLNWLTVRVCGFEELALGEAEHSGNDIGWERLNFCIEIPNHRVVITPGVLNGILSLAKRSLQLRELFGSFQLRIVLGYGE